MNREDSDQAARPGQADIGLYLAHMSEALFLMMPPILSSSRYNVIILQKNKKRKKKKKKKKENIL